MSTKPFPIEMVLDILDALYPYHPMADVTDQEPFKVLMCCLLSIRSPDRVTMPVCMRLFLVADTPQKILNLPEETMAALIEPVQYYHNKISILKNVCRELMTRFDGLVPDSIEALASIKGVGRKTANLVMALGFHEPAITVDIHVHRICNRLGYVATKTPEETEMALREKLPLPYWSLINRVMVRHGQERCVAGRPKCDICPILSLCQQVGVTPRKPPKIPEDPATLQKDTPAAWGLP